MAVEDEIPVRIRPGNGSERKFERHRSVLVVGHVEWEILFRVVGITGSGVGVAGDDQYESEADCSQDR
jgi:hypothetical protein